MIYKSIDKSTYLDFKFNDEAAIAWGEEVYGKWSEDYPCFIKNIVQGGEYADYWQESDPLSHYCGNAYSNANDYYRSKMSGNKYFDSLKSAIDSIVESAPMIPENIVVYRALGDLTFLDFNHLNKLNLTFVELAPMSTSLSASILTRRQGDPSSDFSACRYALKIFVSKGARAIFVDEIAKSNENLNRGELELIFPSGAKLYIARSPYKLWGKMFVDCYLSF